MIRLALPEDSKSDPRYRNRPHCGVTALSIVSGSKHMDIWRQVRDHCGYGPKWRGSMQTGHFPRMLRHLGIEFESHTFGRLSISRFAREHAKKDTTYLILSGTHAQTLQNNRIADQGGVFDIKDYRGKRYHAQWVFEIKTPAAPNPAEVQTFGLPLFDLAA